MHRAGGEGAGQVMHRRPPLIAQGQMVKGDRAHASAQATASQTSAQPAAATNSRAPMPRLRRLKPWPMAQRYRSLHYNGPADRGLYPARARAGVCSAPTSPRTGASRRRLRISSAVRTALTSGACGGPRYGPACAGRSAGRRRPAGSTSHRRPPPRSVRDRPRSARSPPRPARWARRRRRRTRPCRW